MKPVEEAKQNKFHHDRLPVSLRRLCELLARLCGLEPVDADVARADRYVAIMMLTAAWTAAWTAARLSRRLGELVSWEVLCGVLIRLINAIAQVGFRRFPGLRHRAGPGSCLQVRLPASAFLTSESRSGASGGPNCNTRRCGAGGRMPDRR